MNIRGLMGMLAGLISTAPTVRVEDVDPRLVLVEVPCFGCAQMGNPSNMVQVPKAIADHCDQWGLHIVHGHPGFAIIADEGVRMPASEKREFQAILAIPGMMALVDSLCVPEGKQGVYEGAAMEPPEMIPAPTPRVWH